METGNTNPEYNREMRKVKAKYFILGAVAGSIAVSCIKDDSDTIKVLTSSITKIATSYYGCKFIYNLFS